MQMTTDANLNGSVSAALMQTEDTKHDESALRNQQFLSDAQRQVKESLTIWNENKLSDDSLIHLASVWSGNGITPARSADDRKQRWNEALQALQAISDVLEDSCTAFNLINTDHTTLNAQSLAIKISATCLTPCLQESLHDAT